MSQSLSLKETVEEKVRASVLTLFARSNSHPVFIGQACLWIAKDRYGLRETEQLLEAMVLEGVLRRATADELRSFGCVHGYFLTRPV